MSLELNNQTAVMRRYILGELPEPEQLALEERFFADEALADQMRTLEQEMVDAYVRGRLDDEEKAVFERNYLAAPRHVERVAFARELLKIADETPVVGVLRPAFPVSPSFWSRLREFFRGPQVAWTPVIAAAVIAAIVSAGVVWMILGRLRSPNQQARTIQQSEQLRGSEEALARLQEENRRLTAEIERLRAQTEPSPSPSLRSSPASILLLPISRGDSRQQTLRLGPDDKHARLQMKIERGAYAGYRVDLQPVDGGASWRSNSVSVIRSGKALLLSVLTPASRLVPGDYTVTLTGVDAAGAAETIENYSFRVAHR